MSQPTCRFCKLYVYDAREPLETRSGMIGQTRKGFYKWSSKYFRDQSFLIKNSIRASVYTYLGIYIRPGYNAGLFLRRNYIPEYYNDYYYY